MDDELESPAAALAASSATQRKWASVVLLGPLMPSLMATVIIVVGGAIVKASGGMADVVGELEDDRCGYRIDNFLKAAIVNSYLLLTVFAWSFLGFETHFSIRGRKRRFLRPFSSLSFVALLYLLLFSMSMAIWIFGTWAIAKDRVGNSCANEVPLLYSFCLSLVAIYWVGVVFGAVGLIKVLFGKKIQSGAQATVEKGKQYAQNRDKEQVLEAEQQLVARKFDARDEEGNGTIDRQQAEELIEELGIGLSSKKLKKALGRLDPAGEGVVSKQDFIEWYAENGQGG
ncbi:unnamed protein product [Ectocarpus sp. 12 AP-2014]